MSSKAVRGSAFLMILSIAAAASCVCGAHSRGAARLDMRSQCRPTLLTEQAQEAGVPGSEKYAELENGAEWQAFAAAYEAVCSRPDRHVNTVWPVLQDDLREKAKALLSLEKKGLISRAEMEAVEHLSKTVAGRHSDVLLLVSFSGFLEFLRVREDLPHVEKLALEGRCMPWLARELIEPFVKNLRAVERIKPETISDARAHHRQMLSGLRNPDGTDAVTLLQYLPTYEQVVSVLGAAETALGRFQTQTPVFRDKR